MKRVAQDVMRAAKLCYILCAVLMCGCLKSAPIIAPQMPSTAPSGSAEITAANRASKLININTASVAELAALPGIGVGYATRIVEYRQQHGRFRRVEHLLIVPGISETRFRSLQPYIAIE